MFVHGVPETASIWAKVQAEIGRDSIALQMPGFGCDRPAGFAATKDAYLDWLLGELARLPGPADLLGHDWGALLTYRVATCHGDRLRSWVADVGNVAHPDYVWHAFAQLWQAPGEGERFVEGQAAVPVDERAVGLEAMGVPSADALEMAAASDLTMGGCILDLYRSAMPNLHHHWGPWSPSPVPGMVLHVADDPFGDEAMALEVAATLGARCERLDGAGHFWPYQAPQAAVEVLTAFWDSLP